jgi:hypothetical protein
MLYKKMVINKNMDTIEKTKKVKMAMRLKTKKLITRKIMDRSNKNMYKI